MKLVVSVTVLPNYISDLLFIVSCLLQFSSLCRLFSIVHEHRLSTPASDVHIHARLKTTGTAIKIARETTNNIIYKRNIIG